MYPFTAIGRLKRMLFNTLRFKKIAWIRSHHLHLQWKIENMGRKVCIPEVVNKHLKKKVCWYENNVFAFTPQANFPPITGIFTEGEGDGIQSRLAFKIFSTLPWVFPRSSTSNTITSHPFLAVALVSYMAHLLNFPKSENLN